MVLLAFVGSIHRVVEYIPGKKRKTVHFFLFQVDYPQHG